MKIIIAGSRTITDYDIVSEAIFLALWKWKKTYEDVTEVFSGCANGVDRLGEQWAIRNNKQLLFYPADWNKYGKRAGYLRNISMAKHANALIAIWDGKSKGTKHMIDIAKNKNLLIYIYRV